MSLDRRRFLRNLLLGGATVPMLGACGGGGGSGGGGGDDPASPDNPDPTPPVPENPPAPRKLQMMVIGDTGTGGEGQFKVADAMAAVAMERGCDLVLLTGDNVYEQGVTSVDDGQFLEKFEYPYQNLDLPFFLCLGNHDNATTPLGGGSDNKRGDFQVLYHYSNERYSNKWNMPARYYLQKFDSSQGTPFVELFVADSNPLTSFYKDNNEDFSWENYGFPQQRWMKQAVSNSKAHWKIAMSHVPYLSNGKHGNAGNLDEGLRWLFTSPDADGLRYKFFIEECFADRADILFTGHDHVMQWLAPTPDMGRTEIMLSGAGAKTDEIKDPERNPVIYQNEKELGFIWLELGEEQMEVIFYIVSDDGGYRIGHQETRAKPVAAEQDAVLAL